MNNANDDSNKELLQSPFNFTDEHTPVLTLDDVMHSHKRNHGLAGRESLTILREDLWRESVAIVQNPKFKETASSRVPFEGEAGIDDGGNAKDFGLDFCQKPIYLKGLMAENCPSIPWREYTRGCFNWLAK